MRRQRSGQRWDDSAANDGMGGLTSVAGNATALQTRSMGGLTSGTGNVWRQRCRRAHDGWTDVRDQLGTTRRTFVFCAVVVIVVSDSSINACSSNSWWTARAVDLLYSIDWLPTTFSRPSGNRPSASGSTAACSWVNAVVLVQRRTSSTMASNARWRHPVMESRFCQKGSGQKIRVRAMEARRRGGGGGAR